MYRKSIYEDSKKFDSAIKAIESQISSGNSINEIPSKISSDFQEKEIKGLLTLIPKLPELVMKNKILFWHRIALIIFIICLIVNTIFLFVVVGSSAESNIDITKYDTNFAISFLYSFTGLIAFSLVLINAFKESYFGYILSYFGIIIYLFFVQDVFVIFTYKSVFFWLPIISYLVIMYTMFKLYIRQKRFELLRLKKRMIKQEINIESLVGMVLSK